jgi:hypothetical protein
MRRPRPTNPYLTPGEPEFPRDSQKDNSQPGAPGRPQKGNFFAAYPVEPQTKDLLMQWIKAYLAKRKVDAAGLDWMRGPIESKIALASVPGKPSRVFNCLGELKEPFPEDRKHTNYIFAAVDMDNKDRLKDFVERGIPGELFENGVLNLSGLADKLGPPVIDFSKRPATLAYLLFLCAVRCGEQHLQVVDLRCEENKLNTTHAFQAVGRFFPELRRVSLAENDMAAIQKNSRWQTCFGDIEVTFEGFAGGAGQGEYQGWGSRLVYDHGPFAVTIPVHLPDVGESIAIQPSQRTVRTLDSFPPLEFNPNESRLDLFFSSFFEYGARRMREIGQFYWPSAVFSITLDSCSPSSQMARVFGAMDGNLLRAEDDTAQVVVGREKIVAKFFELFRSGFYARPTTMATSVKAHGIGSFVIRGAFALSFDEKSVLGFHRSLVLLSDGNGYAVLNDHLFIHELTG